MPAAHRFFVDDPVTDAVRLGGPIARQIATVLRLAPGQNVVLVHDGDDIEVRLDHVTAAEVRGTVLSRRANAAEPSLYLTLALPILKGDRSEEVVEAVTQLGVSRIVPFVSSRSVVRSLSPAKRRRWEQIARESAETARRGRIPVIDETREWAGLFDGLENPIFLAWEEAGTRHIAAEQIEGSRASLVIGPEGGLSAEEVELGEQHGARVVSLGRRNLRSETAAIAATALVLLPH